MTHRNLFLQAVSITALAFIHSTASVVASVVVVESYSNVTPFVGGASQFTVGITGTGLTVGGLPTDLKVIVFAEVFRLGSYHIVGAFDNYAIRDKYPNGYGFIYPETSTTFGVLEGSHPDRYIAGIDYNSDGRVGSFDTTSGVLTFDPGEFIGADQITIGYEPSFNSGSGYQVRSVSIVPEPSVVPMALLGLAACLFRRKRRSRTRRSTQRLPAVISAAGRCAPGTRAAVGQS